MNNDPWQECRELRALLKDAMIERDELRRKLNRVENPPALVEVGEVKMEVEG